ncbi:hypothetical protein L7F22_006670 [Adiantum nelumboides]|nr:hypothetical protein [Adiantum nelumboides]
MMAPVFLAEGAWMTTRLQLKCLLSPFINIITACLLILAVMALIGICRKSSQVFVLYRIGLFVSIAILLWFSTALFVQTRKGAGKAVTSDFPAAWLQRRVEGAANWAKLKSCLMDADICSTANTHVRKFAGYFSNVTDIIAPLQEGCCRAPTACGRGAARLANCGLWSSDPARLCFNCTSCKARFVQSMSRGWLQLAMLTVALLVALV